MEDVRSKMVILRDEHEAVFLVLMVFKKKRSTAKRATNLNAPTQSRLGRSFWTLEFCTPQVALHHTSTHVATFASHEGILRWPDGQTYRRYQRYYLPCFTVDNKVCGTLSICGDLACDSFSLDVIWLFSLMPNIDIVECRPHPVLDYQSYNFNGFTS